VIALVLAISLVAPGLMGPGVAYAQVPAELDAPWSDVAPRIDGERVIAAAVGMPDERLGRLAARRSGARRAGEERARAMVHRWADDALAQVAASPTIAAAVHRAIDDAATVSRVRPLSDGGAVIEIEIPLAALRAAASLRGLPW